MNKDINIVFIDDEERILRSLKMLFRGKYNVLTTTDPEEVFQLCKTKTIHVLISDQRMPQMMGAQVLKQVAEISPNTMRLLLTGYSDMESIIDSVNEGEIFRYINKPWDPDDIKATVDEAVEIARNISDPGMPELDAIPPLEEPGLLVMDEHEKCAEVVKELSRNRWDVFVAHTLEEGMEILTKQRIGVMVTEIKMNGKNISGAIKSLKKHHPSLLSIVVTSFKDNMALIDLINEGQVFRFLPKPAAKSLLDRSISSAIQRHKSMIATPELVNRHVVKESTKAEDVNVSNNIMGFLKKLRSVPLN